MDTPAPIPPTTPQHNKRKKPEQISDQRKQVILQLLLRREDGENPIKLERGALADLANFL